MADCESCLYNDTCSFAEQKLVEGENCDMFLSIEFFPQEKESFWNEMSYRLGRDKQEDVYVEWEEK